MARESYIIHRGVWSEQNFNFCSIEYTGTNLRWLLDQPPIKIEGMTLRSNNEAIFFLQQTVDTEQTFFFQGLS